MIVKTGFTPPSSLGIHLNVQSALGFFCPPWLRVGGIFTNKCKIVLAPRVLFTIGHTDTNNEENLQICKLQTDGVWKILSFNVKKVM